MICDVNLQLVDWSNNRRWYLPFSFVSLWMRFSSRHDTGAGIRNSSTQEIYGNVWCIVRSASHRVSVFFHPSTWHNGFVNSIERKVECFPCGRAASTVASGFLSIDGPHPHPQYTMHHILDYHISESQHPYKRTAICLGAIHHCRISPHLWFLIFKTLRALLLRPFPLLQARSLP